MKTGNLLEDVFVTLRDVFKTTDDVQWVIWSSGKDKYDDVIDTFWCTWDEFAEQADGMNFGNMVKIDPNIRLIGADWWIERREYDGKEWWEFVAHPFPTFEHRAPTSPSDLEAATY
jgi:hypothetical protein